MSKIDDFAEHIYANNVDLGYPLKHEQTAAQSYQAAEIFFKYAKKQVPAGVTALQKLVDQWLANGKTIQAIKEVRNGTGLGLKEAKDAVDHYKATGDLVLEKK